MGNIIDYGYGPDDMFNKPIFRKSLIINNEDIYREDVDVICLVNASI